MPISAGIKTKSALNATRRVTKRTNVAATVNQVVEMAENLETRITWRRQKRGRKNTQHSPVHQRTRYKMLIAGISDGIFTNIDAL